MNVEVKTEPGSLRSTLLSVRMDAEVKMEPHSPPSTLPSDLPNIDRKGPFKHPPYQYQGLPL